MTWSRWSPAGVCGRCGAAGPLAARAGDEHPNLCHRCYWREARPRRACGRCGRVRQITRRARDGQPDLCANCVPVPRGVCGYCNREGRIVRKESPGSPALGICCYRLPIAVCTDCRRERPCYWAGGEDPVCPKCTALRRAKPCAGCGQRRAAYCRLEVGVVCQTCAIKLGGTTGVRRGCGQTAPLLTGVCVGCRLRERIDKLAANADPGSAELMAPFLLVRLKRYGIDRSRDGRHAALLALAARLPPPILAERIGIDRARTAASVRLAGATYADYVAIRGGA